MKSLTYYGSIIGLPLCVTFILLSIILVSTLTSYTLTQFWVIGLAVIILSDIIIQPLLLLTRHAILPSLVDEEVSLLVSHIMTRIEH